MSNITSTEPVRGATAIQSLLTAVIGLALVFGWVNWSEEQIGAIVLVYTALVVVLGEFTRSKVTPV
jgi:hypothetical protein